MQEYAKLWRADDFGKLELLRATYITHAFEKHMHDSYAIGVIEKGVLAYYNQSGIHIAGAGCLLLINPREPHYGHAMSQEGWTYRMLYPSVALVQEIANQITQRSVAPYFPQPVIYNYALALLIRKAHAMLEEQGSRLACEITLHEALAQLVLQHANPLPHNQTTHSDWRAIQKVQDYLEANHTENITLGQLANIAGFSPYHLLRIFRAQTGLPPHKYLTHIRINRAKTLLSLGTPIKDVAAATGFTDQSHLTRRFKAIVGVTPGQYANVY